jgi:hypothetical protein
VRRSVSVLVAATLVAACALEPRHEITTPAAAGASTRLQEPAANEVIVVINNNAVMGNHAGLFVGKRLSDPAGSYHHVRAWEIGWPGVSLNDYIAFQRSDGERVQTYRFSVESDVLAEIAARLPETDRAAPLFCGAAVNNALAGSGPFAGIQKKWWRTPGAVAAALDEIIARDPSIGACLLPDGSACRREAPNR